MTFVMHDETYMSFFLAELRKLFNLPLLLDIF
jgi:hypothetical protein